MMSRLPLPILAVIAPFGATMLMLHVPLRSPEARLNPPGTVLLDATGEVIYRDVSKGLHIPVALNQVAPAAVQATVAAEDQRYWSHPGIDPIAIARAALKWREGPSGASTITQQLARRLYLGNFEGPAWARKVFEILLALKMERHYSKQHLLELYLNEVYYGRGAYGIEAAARAYFGVSARDIDLAQAALLAGLPQLPGIYDPVADPRPARVRQAYVLTRMAATGRISPEEELWAREESLSFVARDPRPVAPHFVQYVLEEVDRLGLGGIQGSVIETTLDVALQREAERSVRARLGELRDHQVGEAAVIVMEPGTGRLLAMVGNADFWDGDAGQVNIALQPRQPGSALKPFLYAAA